MPLQRALLAHSHSAIANPTRHIKNLQDIGEMLELTEEYAQKCYTFKTKWIENNLLSDYQLKYLSQCPMQIDQKQLERNLEIQEQSKTGIYLIYQNFGSGKFYFRFHGGKSYFDIFMRLSNLQMTDKLDIKPAKCNDDNKRFGLKKVFTIRNTVPVCRIVPAQYKIPEMIPDIAVGKPVVSSFHMFQPCSENPRPESNSAPDYCPPADVIDSEILYLDAAMGMGQLDIERLQNLIEYKSRQRVPTSSDKQATGSSDPKLAENNIQSKKEKKIKPTSLRSALRSSGFKPETAEVSTEKPAQKEAATSKETKCSKSKHQGNARTFKRKTKRSGRV